MNLTNLFKETGKRVSMGEHVAFILKAELKKETPEQVINTLKFMTSDKELELDTFEDLPQHPFFEVDCWEYTLSMGGGELWDTNSTLTLDPRNLVYTLSVRSSVKWGDEQIRLFLHWFVPYSKTEGIMGYIHPEYDRRPSRILFEDGKVYILEPVENTASLAELVEVDHSGSLREMLASMERGNPGFGKSFVQQLDYLAAFPGYQEILKDPAYQEFIQKYQN